VPFDSARAQEFVHSQLKNFTFIKQRGGDVMNTVFVAHHSDELAMQAINILESQGLKTEVINGSKAPMNSVVFFTHPEPTIINWPSKRLRMVPFRLDDKMVPDWASETPFRVALRSSLTGCRNFEDGFENAVISTAESYITWHPGKSGMLAPWRPNENDPTPSHYEDFQRWLERAGAAYFREGNLFGALRGTCRPQDDKPHIPSDDYSIYSMLCPHYVKHGSIGDHTTVNWKKVEKTGAVLKRMKEEAVKGIEEMTIYLPDENLAEYPWRYILTPILWESKNLKKELKEGNLALQSVVSQISKVSGINIKTESYTDIPMDKLKRAHKIIEGDTEDSLQNLILSFSKPIY